MGGLPAAGPTLLHHHGPLEAPPARQCMSLEKDSQLQMAAEIGQSLLVLAQERAARRAAGRGLQEAAGQQECMRSE